MSKLFRQHYFYKLKLSTDYLRGQFKELIAIVVVKKDLSGKGKDFGNISCMEALPGNLNWKSRVTFVNVKEKSLKLFVEMRKREGKMANIFCAIEMKWENLGLLSNLHVTMGI